MSLLSMFALLAAAFLQFPEDYEDAGMTDLQKRQLGYDFGRCVVKQRAKLASRVIVANLTNAEIIRKHSTLIDGNCLVKSWPTNSSGGMQMKLPGDLMRYGLADALIALEFATGLPAELATRPALEHHPVIPTDYEPKPGKKVKPKQLEAMAEAKANALMFRYMARFGECVARANPLLAHRLIMSKPGTAEERAAFSGLKPAFNNCVEVGQTFSVNFTIMRGTVALNAYRLAHGPAAAAGAAR